jgi:hypothetical protein
MIRCHQELHLQSTSFLLAICKHFAEASSAMNATTEPKLGPPGAGLPFPENLIARMLLGLRRAAGNPRSFTDRFVSEREAILQMIEGRDASTLSRRVLIERPPGLEDSSRHWSVLMTLDHLRIVHHGISGVLETLAAGRVPEGGVSTAAVKPDPAVTAGVLDAYRKSCDHLLATVGQIRDFKTTARHIHPWFGPLDAHGWLALASSHHGIHRRQIERILRG